MEGWWKGSFSGRKWSLPLLPLLFTIYSLLNPYPLASAPLTLDHFFSDIQWYLTPWNHSLFFLFSLPLWRYHRINTENLSFVPFGTIYLEFPIFYPVFSYSSSVTISIFQSSVLWLSIFLLSHSLSQIHMHSYHLSCHLVVNTYNSLSLYLSFLLCLSLFVHLCAGHFHLDAQLLHKTHMLKTQHSLSQSKCAPLVNFPCLSMAPPHCQLYRHKTILCLALPNHSATEPCWF